MFKLSSFRKHKPQEETVIGFDVEDKPTPILGKFLLIIMFILLVTFGSEGLDDIDNLIEGPDPISYCIRPFLNTSVDYPSYESNYLNDQYYYQNNSEIECNHSELEKEYGIPALYITYQDDRVAQDAIQDRVSTQQKALNDLNASLRDLQSKYDLTLQEVQAGTEGVNNNPTELAQRINQTETQIDETTRLIQLLNSELTEKKASTENSEDELKIAVNQLEEEYNQQIAVHDLKVFLVRLIFIIPIFIFCFKKYWTHKKKDSPYTLIFATLVAATSLLLLKVLLIYFWELFLAEIIEAIWEFIKLSIFLRAVFWYLGMILIILIFGGSVYQLQKKIFHPTRVFERRLKKKECPYCEFPLDFADENCAGCGKILKEKCQQCGNFRYKVMRFCPHCGSKKTGPASLENM